MDVSNSKCPSSLPPAKVKLISPFIPSSGSAAVTWRKKIFLLLYVLCFHQIFSHFRCTGEYCCSSIWLYLWLSTSYVIPGLNLSNKVCSWMYTHDIIPAPQAKSCSCGTHVNYTRFVAQGIGFITIPKALEADWSRVFIRSHEICTSGYDLNSYFLFYFWLTGLLS